MGSRLALVLVIKNHGKGDEPVPTATEVLRKIDFDSIKCHLYVPRFKYEFKTELKDVLMSMGMGQAFTDDADFSAMVEANNLKISAVIHKAIIEVDEKGTKAAAATVVFSKK